MRLVQFAMLASIGLYILVAERVAGHLRPNPPLTYAFSFVSICVIGVIFVVRRTFLPHAESELIANPENAAILGAGAQAKSPSTRWCESLALFGLVLRRAGFHLFQTGLFISPASR